MPALLAPSGTDQRIALAIMGSGATIVRTEAAAGHVNEGRLVVVEVDWKGAATARTLNGASDRSTDRGAERGAMFRQPVRVAWKGRKPARATADMLAQLRAANATHAAA